MVDFSKIKHESEITHLFIPMQVSAEVHWLLKKAGVTTEDCYIRTWRKVLSHQVPEIANISDEQREAEIERHYGEDVKYVKTAPAVIISNYNVDDLVQALHDTLFAGGDSDYRAYVTALQEEINKESIDYEPGIHIFRKD